MQCGGGVGQLPDLMVVNFKSKFALGCGVGTFELLKFRSCWPYGAQHPGANLPVIRAPGALRAPFLG